ncbi:hypothetical protein MVES_002867 [Malassezia vespertilionis]|uniref:EF-hand domain-containing protein n=1 Tax=Malassezia vespertilionis TaxID=2020962 RepID=A0A2N1J9B1_9BASI|nr:hypothetical protein MVES_002867 [Malassezia vespertilionis]
MLGGAWIGAALLCAAIADARNAAPVKGNNAVLSANPAQGSSNYIQNHMQNEHHINAFDLPSFFALHDLDRNGVWDRAEIEAMYGVHHSLSRKHSPEAEVHDSKADTIVREVLRVLDKNQDSLISRYEFMRGGPSALPSFPEFGKDALGHHYDEESEYYVHHESIYHKKEADQAAEKYTHKEDLQHFADHAKIERQEEDRERIAEGQPTIAEEERLEDVARAMGQTYESKFEKQFTDEAFAQADVDRSMDNLGAAGRELLSDEHLFRTPNGPRTVVSTVENVYMEDGKFGEANEPPAFASDNEKTGGAVRAPPGHIDGETELGRRIRLERSRREASGRPRFGQGKNGFAKPKDDADLPREKQGFLA